MYKYIMIPADLAHVDRLEIAMAVLADQAKHYGGAVMYVAITSNAPSAIAYNIEGFTVKCAYVLKAECALRTQEGVSKRRG